MKYDITAKIREKSGENTFDIEYRVNAKNEREAEKKVLELILDFLSDGHYRIEYVTRLDLSS